MTFTFRDATFRCSTLMLGLAGPSGSGKTKSALRIASGLSPDKPVYVIDTESGRSLLYARQFKFKVLELEAPFTPARYLQAIEAAVADGAGTIVIDSMSHEHEGVGGILEMHDAELTRIAGQDLGKRERAKFSAWIKPKAEHNKLVNRMLQMRVHMLLCFRAKDKLVLVKNENGKQEPISVGWTPICADRLDYECTSMLVLPPGSEGRPDFTAKSFKRNDDLAAIFHDDEQITEGHGTALRQWIAGSSEPAQHATKARRTWSDVLADLSKLADAAENEHDVEALRGHDLVKMIMDKAAENVRQQAERILRDAAERFVPGVDEEAA